MRLTWPLTGRSKELRIIESAILDPDAAGIVVSGSAGVGKSRIVREALNSAATRGCEIRWIVGTSSARTIPLGALTPWARPEGSDGLALVRGVISSLTSASNGHPMVLGVDDAPLLDDLSTVVVHQIIQRRVAKVVLTVRDGEPVPWATQELWRAGELDRLVVAPLGPTDVTELVAATLGGPLDPRAADRLWTWTRGNPLYLRNIVEQEVADGRLAPQHGCWHWSGGPVVPPGLVELVESRIGSLPDSVSDVIDVLAVGEPIELRMLTRITDSAAVEEADRRGLITFEPADGSVEVRVAHPLYGEVRRARAPHTRLRRLRGLVAAGLADSDHRDEIRVVVRRATLALGSDLDPDVDLLLRAAHGAAWLLDLPLADRVADAAVRAGGGADARFIRAFVLSWRGMGQEADAVLADVDAGELTGEERARLAFLRAVNRMFTLADPDGAKRLIDEASRAAALADRSPIDAFLCVYWAAMGKPEKARLLSLTFTPHELKERIGARMAAWAVTVACGDSGRTDEAVAAAEAGYPIPVRAFIVISDAHATALQLAGRIADADGVAEMMRARASVFGGEPFGQIAEALAGQAALGAGRLDTACSVLESAVGLVTAWNTATGFRYRCQISLTTALAMRGLTDQARAARERLDAYRHPSLRHLDYAYAIAVAWVAGCQGAISEAIATVRAAAHTANQNGQFAAEVMCLQTATRFGDASTAHRLRELEEVVEGPRAGTAARFAESLRAGDADELASTSMEFEAMGDLVTAADAAAHAAVIYRRRGLRGSALGCATRAESLAEQCGGARTPALALITDRLPLTDREREIVMLLGSGVSNREIATRLTLSVRTVESHIYKAMAKTGTTSREALAALLVRRRH